MSHSEIQSVYNYVKLWYNVYVVQSNNILILN
jgi:hypothetical protein